MLDLEFSIESVAIVFGTPIMFSDPVCQGQVQPNGMVSKITCAPAAGSTDDFQVRLSEAHSSFTSMLAAASSLTVLCTQDFVTFLTCAVPQLSEWSLRH